jgi:hypothetical protein
VPVVEKAGMDAGLFFAVMEDRISKSYERED